MHYFGEFGSLNGKNDYQARFWTWISYLGQRLSSFLHQYLEYVHHDCQESYCYKILLWLVVAEEIDFVRLSYEVHTAHY